ncbi:MAG: hypothetical protein BGP06_04285 [Rhizobiales bacterium 65-9]|nr:recombinase family protein [Hyphomicrobiales bacterium]OJY36139.1 MAG: hypothetical protein BGP06_04285 [Rhizobiales bacterium 65-9]
MGCHAVRRGYARVSTADQSLEGQIQALEDVGCTLIFQDKASGAKADRPALASLLETLSPGDAVIVTRIDRLARSTFDLFGIVRRIVDAGASFRSIAEPWADTSTSTGRLMLAVLGGVADVERDLIRTRTSEGRQRARQRGVRLGRPSKLTPAQIGEIRRCLGEGGGLAELAHAHGVSLATISRLRGRRNASLPTAKPGCE